VNLAAGEAGAGSVLDNDAVTVPAVGFAIPGDGVAVSVGVVRAVVGVLGGAIALNVKGAALDDTGDALAVLVNFLVEEQVARVIDLFCREWRSTTKHGIVAGRGGGCAIAWKATVTSVDDIVFAVLAFGVLRGRVLGSLLEERRRRRQGLNSRLATKHGGVAVVALGVDGAIAWKATAVSLDDTVDEIFVRVDVLAALVLVLAFGVLKGRVLGSLREERRRHRRGLDSRLTTKHGIFDVLCGGHAIAWRAMDASMDDTMVGVCLGNALAVLVGRVLLLR